jgi:8-oxo-dGTP pyrophosphatase MutT (NUDIX family)
VTGIARPTARVLVVDAGGRVLLFAFRDAGGGRTWLTPGGKVEPGEELAAAAARELREETGIVVPPDALGPVIAHSSGEWRSRTRVYAGHDSYFRLDLAGPVEVDTSGQEEQERARIERYAWWRPDELPATDVVRPARLADLLAGRLPTPTELPWR